MSKIMVKEVVLGVLFAALPSAAQVLSVEVSPSPARRGSEVNLDILNRSDGPVQFGDSCLIRRVSAKGPSGPDIWTAGPCADVVTTLEEGQTLLASWSGRTDAGDFAPPGDYWLHVEVLVGASRIDHAYPARIVASEFAEPRLIQFSNSAAGHSVALGLLAYNYRRGVYAVAASLSTEVGQSSLIGHLALDVDALFGLSFPEPSPEFFTGFQGPLNRLGEALAISVRIPKEPMLEGVTIYLQALVVPSTMDLDHARLTNVVSMLITAN